MEAKFRLAEGRAAEWRDKLLRAQSRIDGLQKNLEEELRSKAAALARARTGFKKTGLILGSLCLLSGVVLGAAAGGVWGRSISHGFEVRALVAEAKTGFYREQIDSLRAEIGGLNERLFGEMEARALASAKLTVLLEQASGKREDGETGSFLSRLKEKWSQGNVSDPTAVMAIPVKTV